jgi:hypothetical protein
MRQQFEELRRECSRLEASLAQSHPEREPAPAPEPVRAPQPVAPVEPVAARPVAPTAATGPRRPPVIRFSAATREEPEAP